MGAGHTVTALYEVVPPNSKSKKHQPSVDPLKYQTSETVSGKVSDELLTIKLRYKEPDGQESKLMEIPVENNLVKNTSDNFRFSAAVAEFGMLLRNSEFAEDTSVDSILELCRSAKGDDEEGYRSEFIQLVKMVNDLKLLSYVK